MKQLFIGRAPIRRRYELSFNDKDCAFELLMKASHLDLLKKSQGFRSHVAAQGLSFGKIWDFTSRRKFGYDGCFRVSLSGSEDVNLKCEVSKRSGLALTLTLVEIFSMLEVIIENEPAGPGDPAQESFLTLSCSSKPAPYGAAMSASLSKEFGLWLYRQDDKLRSAVNPAVENSLGIAFRRLFGCKPEFAGTSGLLERGFVLSPPAGIYTCQFGTLREGVDDFASFEILGHQTFCHNLDYWHQELVCLAGFAKICEAFRNSAGR